MRSFTPRLAITLGVPLLLTLLADQLPLPGVPQELVDGAGGSRANLGVFALGIMPILSAYWMVEVVAFLVPRWSRLRHGAPEGRAKLERASRSLALVLAIFQAWGVAKSLEAMGGGDLAGSIPMPAISVPIVTVTLVGGVCVQFLAARFVSESGLVNGFVALWAGGAIREIHDAVKNALGMTRPARAGMMSLFAPHARALEPRTVAVAVASIAIACVATWAILRGAGDASAEKADGPGGTLYRAARQLVVRPWIALPAGSFQAYTAATSLLMMPRVLANVHLPLEGLARWLEGDGFTPAFAITTLALAAIFAALMNRPAELADLSLRLGAAGTAELARETPRALRRALVPTALFFVAILVASTSSVIGVSAFVLVVAALMDLAHSAWIALRGDGFVPVWEERRAAAVPVLRAALASHGIPTETRGMAFLSLLQVFVPYAPAEILVPEADVERARAMLRHLLLGEPAPERGEAAPKASPGDVAWSFGRRAIVLGACAACAALGGAVLHLRVPEDGPPPPRPKLEVVRVDDTLDVLKAVPETEIPFGEGIEVHRENVPIGVGRHGEVYYARITLRDGESTKSATARLRRWLDGVALPAGARFAFEPVEEFDPDTGKSTVVGMRSFVLVGDPILRTDDVTDAQESMDTGELPQIYVAVTLSDDAAKRFEEATGAWTQRRLAIVVDDEVYSAPVVRTAIGGGRLSITLGGGDPEKQLPQAKRLARGLRGR